MDTFRPRYQVPLEAFKLANSGREDVSQSEINDIAADVIYKLNNLIMGEYDT